MIPSVTVAAHDVGTPGGMERALFELCTGLLERGHRVTVIARRCELPAHPSLRWIRVRVPRRPFSLAYPAFFVVGSLAVRRHRDGLLHTMGAVVGNRADLSTVQFCHHGYRAASGTPQTSRPSHLHRMNAAASAWMSRVAERFCFRPGRTRRLVTVSSGVAQELERFFPRRHDEVVVIPNGVDRAQFTPDAQARTMARNRLGLAPDVLVALFVGGDWDRKGLRFAIEGVAGADAWHLLVVGRGDEPRHRALAGRCGAGDRVHFVGGTPEPARYYASADAFVLPSAYEAFPLVGLEAAAAGLPLIAAHVSGAEELIEEERNGWLVERDATAITERLRTLGADPALRTAMGRAARHSSARYTWDRIVGAYAELYETLADPELPVMRQPSSL
ncbi:MAG: glycosyltransferase family 4 protein [Solirubrobacteraceae bacterium]